MASRDQEKMREAIELVALEVLQLKSLQPAKSDAEDFREFAVWEIEAALVAAYLAGKREGQR